MVTLVLGTLEFRMQRIFSKDFLGNHPTNWLLCRTQCHWVIYQETHLRTRLDIMMA